MAAPLHAKVQMLAALLIAFTLLSVPLFFQARADAREDQSRVKNTTLAKFFDKVAKQIRGEDVNPENVEDYWGDYQKENPCTGPECNPDGDLDGDGMGNQAELEAGRNPDCNEETEEQEHWKGYCAGDPKPPGTGGNQTGALDDILFNKTGLSINFNNPFDVSSVSPNYDKWEVSWRVTGYQGTGYTVRIRGEDGATVCCDRDSAVSTLLVGNQEDSGFDQVTGANVPPSGASYSLRIEGDSTTTSGSWSVTVRGIRDA